MGRDRDADQTFIRHMSAHHAKGTVLARSAAERAKNLHLRELAILMVVSQVGEIRMFGNWRLSWFDTKMADCSTTSAPPCQGAGGAVRRGVRADHEQASHGAARMAEQMLQSDGDPRLHVITYAIRHAQQGEIAPMHGARAAFRLN
ncbi:DUF305 domain-containing protein [Bradyrhizobium japonicum]|uniref:DUF305 domain-containing protein n=1 Tax=Bradyrhizobium japonicum TaxID=375 RepID=UPI002012842C|nr:DUF305 domain-containing protein [Bradyrhizobium japonicum]